MNGAEETTNGRTTPDAEVQDPSAPPTEAEVQTIIQTIKDVSGSSPPSPTPSQHSYFSSDDELDEGAYWDLSSMAPLNAVSAVSI